MTGAKQWGPTDRTGGPLDEILSGVRAQFPSALVTRLQGTHPNDDDNVYWVRVGSAEIQIDTSDGGCPPFVVEGAEAVSRLDTVDASEAGDHALALLALVRGEP
jgi:hypothetical protein